MTCNYTLVQTVKGGRLRLASVGFVQYHTTAHPAFNPHPITNEVFPTQHLNFTLSHTNEARESQSKLRVNAVNGLDHAECFINGVGFAPTGWLGVNQALSVRPRIVRGKAGCNRVLVNA